MRMKMGMKRNMRREKDAAKVLERVTDVVEEDEDDDDEEDDDAVVGVIEEEEV